jgi:hypothetical protein
MRRAHVPGYCFFVKRGPDLASTPPSTPAWVGTFSFRMLRAVPALGGPTLFCGAPPSATGTTPNGSSNAVVDGKFPARNQAAAVASRQVCMADARKARCVLVEVR